MTIEFRLSDEDFESIRAIVREEIEAAFMRRRDTPLRYYTIKEAAELLRVSRPTINAWMRQGRLKYHKEGNRVLFKEEDLDWKHKQ